MTLFFGDVKRALYKSIFRSPVPNTDGMSCARGKLRPIAGGYIHGVIGWTTSVQKLID